MFYLSWIAVVLVLLSLDCRSYATADEVGSLSIVVLCVLVITEILSSYSFQRRKSLAKLGRTSGSH